MLRKDGTMRWIGLIILFGLAGCAGTETYRVSNEALKIDGKMDDSQADGIRYYESAPFILVYSDGTGGLQSKFLFMPDLTQKRVISPYEILASNTTTLKFENGVLTEGSTTVDTTVVPKAIIGSLEKVAIGLAAGAFNTARGSKPSAQLPPPRLYKVVVDGESARLAGGPGVNPDGTVRMIDVTISRPGPITPPSSQTSNPTTGGGS